MRTIYKYPLGVAACSIDLPVGSKVLCAHEQHGNPTVWIEQDLALEATDVFQFYVVPTGGDVPTGTDYIGTAFIGRTVWHIYYKKS